MFVTLIFFQIIFHFSGKLMPVGRSSETKKTNICNHEESDLTEGVISGAVLLFYMDVKIGLSH
jgi:hypothetical protein